MPDQERKMTTTDEGAPLALEPKTKLSGKIVKVSLAGALVDVNQPLPGVLHISQLQKEPVNKVEDVLKEGQAVDVWVRRVRKDRIELTMIRPLAYEWQDLEPEMVVRGKVVRLEPYGAFVDFGAERPGMIHISELARGYVKAAADVVKEGDEIEAKVLNVDRKKRQIRLSMKALQPEVAEPEKPAREERKPKGKRGGRKQTEAEAEPEADSTPAEPELTAMQVAWQTAQDRANTRDKDRKSKRSKTASAEQEEILSRTLQKRLPTGG
jgi:predicted RNA-binding protein with RPS1 domain